MAPILVVTHPDGGTSGVFAQAAADGGHRLEEWSPADHPGPPAPLDAYAALVVLGGGQNVVETERYPYLRGEIELIAAWHASGRPLLGVCLGAQLLAAALGGRVVRLGAPEIGWYDAERLPAGADDPVRGAGGPRLRTYQWHSWAVDPPAGAIELARNDACLQAYRVGNSWGVQFHPEVTAAIAEAWTDDWRADPDAVATGFDPVAAKAELARELPAWNAYGRDLFARFCALAG